MSPNCTKTHTNTLNYSLNYVENGTTAPSTIKTTHKDFFWIENERWQGRWADNRGTYTAQCETHKWNNSFSFPAFQCGWETDLLISFYHLHSPSLYLIPLSHNLLHSIFVCENRVGSWCGACACLSTHFLRDLGITATAHSPRHARHCQLFLLFKNVGFLCYVDAGFLTNTFMCSQNFTCSVHFSNCC